MEDVTGRMKQQIGKGAFGPEFIAAAREDMPRIIGRLSLLEEFYSLTTTGGDPNRLSNLHDQLGAPLRWHGSALRKLLAAITG